MKMDRSQILPSGWATDDAASANLGYPHCCVGTEFGDTTSEKSNFMT